MPIPTPPTLTFYDFEGTVFSVDVANIKGITVEVADDGVIGLSAVKFYLTRQDDIAHQIDRQSYYCLQGMFTTLVRGTAPMPVLSIEEAIQLQNTLGLFRQWLAPLILTPPEPLPP